MSEKPPKSNADDADADDWQDVFSSCEAGLRAFLGARLRPHDVDDCLQVVCMKMLQNGDGVAVAARRAWLFRVAANEAAALWRRKATTDRVLEKQAESVSDATDEDAAERAILTETGEQIRLAIKKLPD